MNIIPYSFSRSAYSTCRHTYLRALPAGILALQPHHKALLDQTHGALVALKFVHNLQNIEKKWRMRNESNLHECTSV